jgi:hypothetical protein
MKTQRRNENEPIMLKFHTPTYVTSEKCLECGTTLTDLGYHVTGCLSCGWSGYNTDEKMYHFNPLGRWTYGKPVRVATPGNVRP